MRTCNHWLVNMNDPQDTRPPCPSPTPGVHSDSHPLSRWCHPAISSVHGILQAKILEWVAISFSKCLPRLPYLNTNPSAPSLRAGNTTPMHWQADSLPLCHLGSPDTTRDVSQRPRSLECTLLGALKKRTIQIRSHRFSIREDTEHSKASAWVGHRSCSDLGPPARPGIGWVGWSNL